MALTPIGDLMQLVQLVAILAVLQYILFGKLTGNARAKSGLKAPAIRPPSVCQLRQREAR